MSEQSIRLHVSTAPTVSTGRPARSPPRNEEGDIICIHADCKDEQPIFTRLCEFNIHMDKHERPYKCDNADCRKNRGFTYAGGLSRHRREVHNMHRTKEPLFCPHSGCDRSAGSGFSRRENLDEHLRRRHSGFSDVDNIDPTSKGPYSEQLASLSTDRKRSLSLSADDTVDSNLTSVEVLRSEIKELKTKLFLKEQLLSRALASI